MAQSAVEPATPAPVDMAATRQRAWDDSCCQRSSSLLLSSARWMTVSGHGSASASLPRQALGCRLSRFYPWACRWTTTSSGWRWVCVSALTCVSHTHAHAVSSWMLPWHARVGLQVEVQDVTRHGLLNGRRVACDAASPGAVLQGASGSQQVRR